MVALVAAFYGLASRWGWRQSGIVIQAIGVLGLFVALWISADPKGPDPTVTIVAGAITAASLLLLGHALRRRKPRQPPADYLAATLAPPVACDRAFHRDDVLGAWHFYVDAVASTVTIDLRPDGRYTQVIARNSGGAIDCPGGVWTLEGPYLELASYRSALRATTQNVRWFFGEWENGLVLCAKDDPDAATTLLGLKR